MSRCLGVDLPESREPHRTSTYAALKAQVEQWLTPHELEIGKVVCDNGSITSSMGKGW